MTAVLPLDGKVALVTGGGSGIGRATAESFAAAGATVAIVDIDPLRVEAAVETLSTVAQRSIGIVADCGDVAAIGTMFDRVVTDLGGIDILVNNAGTTFPSTVLEITEEGWDRIARLNGKGAFFCMQRAAREMIRQGRGGRILNIASISGRGYAGAGNAAYVATKGGLISLTWIAAAQLGPHGINVNAICPGLTKTALIDEFMAVKAEAVGKSAASLIAEAVRTIPIGRINEAADIAAMALFLAGPGGRNITGQAINIDGGLVTA